MKEFKRKIVVLKDGRIVIHDVPAEEGQEVEVTIRVPDSRRPAYPLRGLPVRYDRPFHAVDEKDWDALK